MIISVKNHSRIPDAEVLAAIRAVNRQIAEDFPPGARRGGRPLARDAPVLCITADL